MIQVAAYCRVSTDKEDQANSFASQQSYFKEYISKNPEWVLYKIYADEGRSGTSTKKRKQFNRMIQDAHEGRFQMILTKEVSRFSRNIVDTLSYTRDLKRIGVAVEFVTDHINTMDGDGELRLSIMASLAQEESRRTSNRVVWGQTRQMEKGVVFGRSMLGYEVADGKLMVEPTGAEIVRFIFQKYAVEQVGTSEIARLLTQMGYRTYRGSKNWNASAVVKILKNEKYAGDLVQKKTYTPDYLTHEKKTNKGEVPLIILKNHHAPIVSREIWDLAQKRMQRNNKHREGERGHSNRYVFSGRIKCAACGASFVGRMKVLKDGTRIRRWSCGTATSEGRAGCAVGKLIRDDDALNMLRIAVNSLSLDTREITRNVTSLAMEAIRSAVGAAEDKPEQLKFELERIQQKKAAAFDSYFSGDIAKEDMLALKSKYDGQSESLKKRIKKAEEQRLLGNGTEALRREIQADVDSLLRFHRESEVLCKTLLDRLTVFPDRHLELRLNDLPQVFRFVG